METQQEGKKQKICIVGGGLSGPLMAIMLARQGYSVKIMEGRSDMRQQVIQAGRSISLTLSGKGLHALELIGLKEQVLKMTVPIVGFWVHDREGNSQQVRFGSDDSQAVYAVSRRELNCILLGAAEETQGVEIHFDTQCTNYDLRTNTLHFKNKDQQEFQLIDHLVIGADGFNSMIRNALMKDTRLNFTQVFESHGYKELNMPAGPNGEWQLQTNGIHVWSREKFTMLAIANEKAKTFNCILYLSHQDDSDNFEQLKTDQQIIDFFQKYFPDIYLLIPDLVQQFQKNAIASLCTKRSSPWNYKDQAILIGDAAHCFVPFYGQGMNCAFEDCTIFAELLGSYKEKDLNQEQWTTFLSDFFKLRKPNVDAIQDMAADLFHEMKDHMNDPFNLLKKQCEMMVAQKYPDYLPVQSIVYSMTPYRVAQKKGEIHEEVFTELCMKCNDPSTFDVDLAYDMIQIRYRTIEVCQ